MEDVSIFVHEMSLSIIADCSAVRERVLPLPQSAVLSDSITATTQHMTPSVYTQLYSQAHCQLLTTTVCKPADRQTPTGSLTNSTLTQFRRSLKTSLFGQ